MRRSWHGRSPSPWFPLGTDGLGRDVLSRLVLGARVSLGVAFVAAAGALLGTQLGLRWLPVRALRYSLVAVLLIASGKLLFA